ncbi:pyridoxamine 5'-phosphate oxidase family protein [Streptomyces sp. NBC_01267]|uniref:helix-turn-helix domain-containing protein n=1 Tax=unclassified Streptomyces TaxID=2593676 RepID=UPI002258EB2F|nr:MULTISPECIES: pyridoxamine 5'-phosphate oxidase family protein [unclassified Streptomyces]MCX4553498.1 pyridoxamine 5'-phosphate oxidase family protein [Streptomyces sp. NBC_01500]WSC24474.1 pyridoxamine 5'-phosphate oxidase family protein [Streptomyces sp. NBC_01766]WSV58454.1 pyridoxamine 5'-phosphate oxidase family protein [Streptomyces sp. NBC_01014]
MPDHSRETSRGQTAHAPRSDLGRRVMARREQLGLSRDALAERAGSVPSYVEYVEERQATPSIGFMLSLADALETTVGALTGSDTELPPGTGQAAYRPKLTMLSSKECGELLSTHGVGRIAVSTWNGPAVIPVNYLVIDGEIAYRTAPGTVAAEAVDHEVAFEVDHIDEAMSKGWSINVVGTARAVADDTAAQALDQHAYTTPWAGGDRRLWVSISPARTTGRRIDIASADGPAY